MPQTDSKTPTLRVRAFRDQCADALGVPFFEEYHEDPQKGMIEMVLPDCFHISLAAQLALASVLSVSPDNVDLGPRGYAQTLDEVDEHLVLKVEGVQFPLLATIAMDPDHVNDTRKDVAELLWYMGYPCQLFRQVDRYRHTWEVQIVDDAIEWRIASLVAMRLHVRDDSAVVFSYESPSDGEFIPRVIAASDARVLRDLYDRTKARLEEEVADEEDGDDEKKVVPMLPVEKIRM